MLLLSESERLKNITKKEKKRVNIKNREQRESVKLKGAKKLPNEKARNKK